MRICLSLWWRKWEWESLSHLLRVSPLLYVHYLLLSTQSLKRPGHRRLSKGSRQCRAAGTTTNWCLPGWLAVWLTGQLILSRAAWLAGRQADTSRSSTVWAGGETKRGITPDRLAKVALGLRWMWGDLKCIKHLWNDKLEWNLSALLEED